MDHDWVTIGDAAKALNIGYSRAYFLAMTGKLKVAPEKLGGVWLVSRVSVQVYLQAKNDQNGDSHSDEVA